MKPFQLNSPIRGIGPAVFLALSAGGCSPRTEAIAPARTSVDITPADVRSRIYLVADDSMLGRAAGTPGNFTMTSYIAKEMQRLGLEPGGENGTWFQTIPMVRRSADSASSLVVNGTALRVFTDFVPLRPSSTVRFSTTLADATYESIYGGRLGDTSVVLPTIRRCEPDCPVRCAAWCGWKTDERLLDRCSAGNCTVPGCRRTHCVSTRPSDWKYDSIARIWIDGHRSAEDTVRPDDDIRCCGEDHGQTTCRGQSRHTRRARQDKCSVRGPSRAGTRAKRDRNSARKRSPAPRAVCRNRRAQRSHCALVACGRSRLAVVIQPRDAPERKRRSRHEIDSSHRGGKPPDPRDARQPAAHSCPAAGFDFQRSGRRRLRISRSSRDRRMAVESGAAAKIDHASCGIPRKNQVCWDQRGSPTTRRFLMIRSSRRSTWTWSAGERRGTIRAEGLATSRSWVRAVSRPISATSSIQ